MRSLTSCSSRSRISTRTQGQLTPSLSRVLNLSHIHFFLFLPFPPSRSLSRSRTLSLSLSELSWIAAWQSCIPRGALQRGEAGVQSGTGWHSGVAGHC